MHKLNRDYFSLNHRTCLNKGKIVPINFLYFAECVGFFTECLRFFHKVKEVQYLWSRIAIYAKYDIIEREVYSTVIECMQNNIFACNKIHCLQNLLFFKTYSIKVWSIHWNYLLFSSWFNNFCMYIIEDFLNLSVWAW